MFKKILFHLCIAAAVFWFASLQKGLVPRGMWGAADAWRQVMAAGMIYGVVSPILILFGVNLPYPFGRNASKKATAELLECKKLLDAGLITKTEFDRKSHELKKIIL